MDVLLKEDLKFTVEDVRRNVLLPFRVDKDYERIVVRLHYGPKYVRDQAVIGPQIAECVRKYFPKGQELTAEDMKEFQQLLNFVTLSIDKDGEYVGCAHRHAPEQQIEISSKGSEWGFAPLAAGPGDWRVVLHVQAVVDGTVDYHIVVCGMEGGEGDDLIPSV